MSAMAPRSSPSSSSSSSSRRLWSAPLDIEAPVYQWSCHAHDPCVVLWLGMPSLVGLDLVDVREVAESVERFGERYLQRCYTPAEVAYAMSAGDRATSVRRLAARWAAKEATIKALGASERGISPRDIEVV